MAGMEGMDVYAAGSAQAGKICGVCMTPILSGSEIVFCPTDGEACHRECWEHNGGCPRFGCDQAPGQDGVDAQALSALTGASDYQCPKCRKMVQANLLQCTNCGRPFDLQEVVSSLEYEDFLFHAEDDHRQQKYLWVLLGVAASIVLAPITFIVLGYVKIRGSLGRFRTKHMLSDTFALFYGTLAFSGIASALLGCLLIFK